ncbi:MAG: 2Fe-2S iron-sulfur cluster binding domain-containing protein [Proteobacteria bacterium]|nr:2Fe-2S iron-sulfur cluster binding domain-containing protein [Pseudomonadota bacterium]
MSYRLTIEPLGQTVELRAGQTLLDAALRAGVWLPHACCHGLCATCKVQVRCGAVDYGQASPFALMDGERDDGKCLACCATADSDVVIEADIDEEPDALCIPLQDHEGVVERIADLTPTIKGIWLRVDGEVAFQAGQYLQLQVPGIDAPRAFSFANAPSQRGLVELNVRKVPGGAATGWLHEQLQLGDRLRFSGPYGRFFVRRSDPRPLIFVAGGSGLASPKSMLLDLLEAGDAREIHVFHGARNEAELYGAEALRELEGAHPNVHYVPALSESAGADWRGFEGFVHDALHDRFDGDFRGHKAYLCGPPPMIEAAIRTLMRGRLFERDIHVEKFVTAGDAPQACSPLFRNL